MLNPERPEINFNPLENFHRGIIALCPEEWQESLRDIYSSAEKGSDLIREKIVEHFGSLTGLKDLKESLSLPQYGFETNIIPFIERDVDERLLNVCAVFTKRLTDKQLAYAGCISLFFHEKKQACLHILVREIKEQGKGIGLDLECQIEDLCRRHDIWTIENNPTSNERTGQIGGYVWALYGYEFVNENDKGFIIKNIISFATKNEIIIDEQALRQCQRPLDFAKFKGKDKNGKEAPVGKLSLLNGSYWDGRRDLRFDSQGTKDFVAYLAQRGRTDLIEKYYPMFLEKNEQIG